MKQSEQARCEDQEDGQRNEEKLVHGTREDGHWPEGQHAPVKDQGFDRAHQGAPRADDRSGYEGQSAYGSLEAPSESAVRGKESSDSKAERGGLTRYGNGLGSSYSVDQQAATSKSSAASLGKAGSAPGASPASTDVGQYAGEYDDTPDKLPNPAQTSKTRDRPAASSQQATQQVATPAAALRGDEQLKEEIHQRLTEHPDLDFHDISVALSSGHAVLEGSVPDANMKELIVQIVDNVNGVLKIDDRVTVKHLDLANQQTAKTYAAGGQVSDDVQHSGPATFGAASAKAAAMKEQNGEENKDASKQGDGQSGKAQ